ncbi:hypothetical protein [Angelakisella massiliensis]|uniref:hypothetical protein n=1 Tax=Angelakisella massiliensis TaxID=1871018 RepID=UPI0023A8C97C|nr:hypothetical protein [Angelakisella massiliensis]
MKKELISIALVLALTVTGCASAAPSSSSQSESASASQSASVSDSAEAVSSATTSESSSSSSEAAETPDAVSSASLIFYEDSSLTGEELRQAIRDAEGSCSVATVNDDGTVNLANFVPYPAGEDHLSFTFSENVTKANLAAGRDGMVSYYIYTKDAADKNERNKGARFRIALETDQAVIDQLAAENPEIPVGATFVRILEVLPLG